MTNYVLREPEYFSIEDFLLVAEDFFTFLKILV